MATIKSYTDELWKDVVGWEGLYQVSSFGRVKSFRRKEPHLLSACVGKHGYCVVLLYNGNGQRKNERVHRLVAQAFIPNPNGYPYINHKDEDRTNNHVDNLEWCTAEYNSNYGTCKITGLHNGVFTITNQDGSYFFNQFESTTEPVFHLWTIQDAKDGDVLVSSSGKPFIFKGFFDNDPMAYGGLVADDSFWPASNSNWTTVYCKPATKEQRDLLFQKMKGAGYEWDAEKKELKKIEKKPNNQFTLEQADILDKHIDKFLEQKSVWCEEDEKGIQNTIALIEGVKNSNPKDEYCVESCDYCLHWLKSLKDRVQPQPIKELNKESVTDLADYIEKSGKAYELNLPNRRYDIYAFAKDIIKHLQINILQNRWSEEDKGNLFDVKCIIDEVWHNQYVREEIDHSGEELESLWHWLNKLWQRVEYPQSHWRPSDEQMDALETATSSLQSTALESLYNELKKL